ncbi:MAG TPA: hypothetical protein PLM53_04865 [Spirochaetota bacterium]|nr:hypothetical protein [Spirochaetota bacterium]HPC40378.1 hypothetical protein [Spirochaetota bacterium]HPL18232.1 hypothetical protein [Spirochaetota bacterium]HQF07677.1 hypothetical protein [Spirochaetota bacterium]HQH96409.1 hypothetical protein [Spirochaetota bacterium]
MDITKIKNFFITNITPLLNLSTLWNKAKEAVKLPYAKTYIALAFFMLVVFLVITFPYDMLLRKKMKDLEKTSFKTLNVNEINFSIIDIIEMNGIYAMTQGGSEITVKNTEIDISILRLLISKDIKGTIQMNGFKYSGPSTMISFNMNGNLYIDYKSFADVPQGGDINIIIENAMLKITDIPLPESMGGMPLSLPPVRISSIKIEADIAKNRVNVKNIRIFGKDLNGTITGSINLSKNFMTSGLDLRIKINANSPALENYKDFLTKFINDSNQVVFQVRGSLMMPRIEIPRGDTEESPKSEHPMDKIIPVQ